MRNKTYKLQKLEKNRYSILTEDMDRCYLCKNLFVDIHEIYGGSNRKISMQNGLCVPLCRNCHIKVTINNDASLYLKRKCQKKFEEAYSREKFMKLIGRNYLD